MQQMAQGLASLGRGQDSMLVHMTPGEVHGLQSLAMAHGGSLTINPQTGLPEAGFLSSLLPMIGAGIGIAMAPATGGASLYAMGGGALGGMLGSSMEGKSVLMGGLMGGISGYSMSGLMDAFAGAASTVPLGTGAFEAGMGALPTAPPVTPDMATAARLGPVGEYTGAITANPADFIQPNASPFGANPYALQAPMATPTPAATYFGPEGNMAQPYNPAVTYGPEGGGGIAAPVTASVSAPVVTTPVATPTFSGIPDDYSGRVPFSASAPIPPPQSYMDKVSSGFSNTMDKPLMPFLKANAGKIAGVALPVGLAGIEAMAKQPTLPASMARPVVPNQFYNAQYNPGQRNPNFGQPGQPYFLGQGYGSSGFSTAYAAAGGSMQDIQANARPILPPNQMIGGSTPNENEFYPGANIARGGASYAPQAPSATEVVGGYDQSINQYTGEPVRMKKGGKTSRDIYSDDSGPGPYNDKGMPSSGQYDTEINESADPFAGLGASVDKMSPAMLSQLIKGAKNPALQAAAKTELDSREYSPNSYIETAAQGGLMGLASSNEYAAGGRLLQGPGDGMSDSIPAVIKGAKPQRAALAQGEFVLPADVVSHLGNGSTDAGSKRLYAMMDKIRHARTGSKKQGRQINPEQFMPA